jgi:uncharacterized protein YbaP (TraB family)
MFSWRIIFFVVAAFVTLTLFSDGAETHACVWKVTGPNDSTLYLGGSVHGLLSADYPLPPAYNRAFDDSSALVIEEDVNVSLSKARSFYKSGFYPKSDSLKNHVDPRTYDYLRRLFDLSHIPEAQWSKCKPWMLTMTILSTSTNNLGIEAHLIRRARANHKQVLGIESFQEHAEVISGMPDKQAELVLLFNFIPQDEQSERRNQLIAEWRRGDVDALASREAQVFHDLPSYRERLINERNRNWLPKIEDYLTHRDKYFVVVGAAHLGGAQGVLALLRSRGYKLEQL